MNQEQAAAFSKELAKLSTKQAETLTTATYGTISDEEWAAYEKRRERISQLCTLLSSYHPSGPSVPLCTHDRNQANDEAAS